MRTKRDGTLWFDVPNVSLRDDIPLDVCSRPGCSLHAMPGRAGCFGHDDQGRRPHPARRSRA